MVKGLVHVEECRYKEIRKFGCNHNEKVLEVFNLEIIKNKILIKIKKENNRLKNLFNLSLSISIFI